MTSAPPQISGTRLRLSSTAMRPVLGLLGVVRLPAQALPDLIAKTLADPDLSHLCMQMFYVLLALDQRAFALDMQARALQLRCAYRITGAKKPTLRLLALMAPGDMLDNTPFEFLLENSDIQLELLYVLP